MKKSNKILLMGIGLFLLLVGYAGSRNGFSERDVKLGLLTEHGIGIVSVSRERRMINELTVSSETMVWVPKGLGWYRSDRIMKLLKQEGRDELAGDLFFYNFGMVPDVVLDLDNDDSWENNWQFISKWGIQNWLRFKLEEGQMRYKQETQKSEFDEILPRDFSDSLMAKEDLKVSIYNASDNMGLASFMAKVLEWSGLTVVGVENYPTKVEMCKIVVSSENKLSLGIKFLTKQMKECAVEKSTELSEDNVEIYFGEKFAQMLNYQSYKNN